MKYTSKDKATTIKYFSFWDLTILLAVLFVFVCYLIPMLNTSSKDEAESLQAVITVNGAERDIIELSDVSRPYEYTIDGETSVTISISSSGVCFLQSECPDKLCVNTGMLNKAGQSAVCLPARVSLKLVCSSVADEKIPDAVVG